MFHTSRSDPTIHDKELIWEENNNYDVKKYHNISILDKEKEYIISKIWNRGKKYFMCLEGRKEIFEVPVVILASYPKSIMKKWKNKKLIFSGEERFYFINVLDAL